MSPLKWWARRTLRLRVTATATLVLAIGLVLGTTVLSSLFFHSRVKVVDADGARRAHHRDATGGRRRPSGSLAVGAGRYRVRPGSRLRPTPCSRRRRRRVRSCRYCRSQRSRIDSVTHSRRRASSLGTTPLRVEAQTATLRGVPGDRTRRCAVRRRHVGARRVAQRGADRGAARAARGRRGDLARGRISAAPGRRHARGCRCRRRQREQHRAATCRTAER